jgi:hypothetical protein
MAGRRGERRGHGSAGRSPKTAASPGTTEANERNCLANLGRSHRGGYEDETNGTVSSNHATT